MRNQPNSGRDWTWGPFQWREEYGLNIDRVDNWIITPRELQQHIASEAPLVLVDIRERWEFEIVSLPGSQLIPLNELGYRAVDELDPEEEIVLVCHHGIRSMEAARLLWDLGYEHVKSLTGGIDRWTTEVDSTLPRY